MATVAWAGPTILWLESVSHDCTFAPDDTIRMNVRLDSNNLPVDLAGMDIVEVSPPYDGPGAITGVLAANLLFELLSVVALGR